jgi:hypothetical protein
MQAIQEKFITLLSGDKLQQDIAAQAQRQNDRRGAFDQALASLTQPRKRTDPDRTTTDKEEIAAVMKKARVVDKHGKAHESAFSDQGQEHALDTFQATRKGRGLTKGDMKKVGGAMKMISDAAQGLLAQKTSDGKPLFDTQAEFELALTQELFTPLIREGVLPDNFVIDQYSEVQQLLNASFRSYKKRLTGEKDVQEGKDAVQAVKRSGAGDGVLGSQRLDQFLATKARKRSA